jgi:hypothetical protein
MSLVYFIGTGLVDAEDVVSGKVVLDPKSIAYGLSGRKRFSGQSEKKQDFDVLRHSLMTGTLAARIARATLYADGGEDLGTQPINTLSAYQLTVMECELWGILHDASEAVMADVAAPVKRTETLREYAVAEHALGEFYQREYIPSLWDKENPDVAAARRRTVNRIVHVADMVRLNLEAIMLLPEDAAQNIIDSTEDAEVIRWRERELVAATRKGGYGSPISWDSREVPVEYFQRKVSHLRGKIFVEYTELKKGHLI